MRKLIQHIFVLLPAMGFAAGNLSAGPLFTSQIVGGETDTLSIVLDPPNGAVSGVAGSTAGWGFTVDWTAAGNFISFTGSSLGSVLSGETNNSFLAAYTDFIGANSGPDGIALGPGTWTQPFDAISGTGVGSYAISTNPSLAIPLAEDTGQITFNFDIYSGNPAVSGAYLGSYSYYGGPTAFSVTVENPIPEPGTLWLLCAGAGMPALFRVRKHAPAPTQNVA